MRKGSVAITETHFRIGGGAPDDILELELEKASVERGAVQMRCMPFRLFLRRVQMLGVADRYQYLAASPCSMPGETMV
jgi:hypothetical protein